MALHWKKKARSRRYPAETIKDADYTDDQEDLKNTPAEAEYQLHSLEQAAWGFSLNMDVNKTEFICFNEKAPPLL